MYDYVVVLDENLRCPHDHQVDGFQTKSFDTPSMATYLLSGPCLHLVARTGLDDDAEIVFYTVCDECAPMLVRSDRLRNWGDVVDERRLWVEFRVTARCRTASEQWWRRSPQVSPALRVLDHRAKDRLAGPGEHHADAGGQGHEHCGGEAIGEVQA